LFDWFTNFYFSFFFFFFFFFFPSRYWRKRAEMLMRHGSIDSGFMRCINSARNARARTACVRVAVKRLRSRRFDPSYRLCISRLPTLKNSGFLAVGGTVSDDSGNTADEADAGDNDDDNNDDEDEDEDEDDDGNEAMLDDGRKVFRTRIVYKVRPRHVYRVRHIRRRATKWKTKWLTKDVVVTRNMMMPVTRAEALVDARYVRKCIANAIARREDRRRKVALAKKMGDEMRKAQNEIKNLKAFTMTRKRKPPKITKRVIRVVVGRLGPSRAAKVIKRARKLGWTEKRLFYFAMGLKHPLLPKDSSVTTKGNFQSVYKDRVNKVAKRRFRTLAQRFLRSYFEGGPTGEARNVKMNDNDPFKKMN
jgi:hypothetical protein